MKKKEKILLKDKLSELCKKLVYISETDAEIEVFIGKKASAITTEEILIQTKSSPNVSVEEIKFEEFFLRLTKTQDWFGTEQKNNVAKFKELEKYLIENLINKKVFRIGKIKIDIYVVGLDAENNLSGIKTKAVET